MLHGGKGHGQIITEFLADGSSIAVSQHSHPILSEISHRGVLIPRSFGTPSIVRESELRKDFRPLVSSE